MLAKSNRQARERRHERTRKKVKGSKERPRLSVYRSLNHIYAQIVDDGEGRTLVAASSLDESLKALKQHRGNCKTAREVGALIARRAQEKEIRKVAFDRGGYLYHGRVKALADAAREAGLEF